jgi:hypothetical protein
MTRRTTTRGGANGRHPAIGRRPSNGRRSSKGRRHTNRIWFSALAALVLLVAFLAARPLWRQQGDGPSQDAIPLLGQPGICTVQGVACVDLWGFAWGIKVSTSNPSKGAIVWERGGPGLTAPADVEGVRASLPAWTAAYDVLIVSEPWERVRPSDTCLAAIGGQMHAVVDDGVQATNSALSSCTGAFVWWTADTYTRAIQELESRTASRVIGFYGESFGAVEAPWLATFLRDRAGWVVAHAPAPDPSTTTGADLIQRRARAIGSLVAEGLENACGGDRRSCSLPANVLTGGLMA